MAENTSENIFYPGYYPGSPLPRPPRGGRRVRPEEYKPDVFNEYISQIEFDVTGVPKWLKNKLVDDVKKSFKVNVTPKEDSYSAQEIKDDPDSEELPGAAGLEINLNPLDWIKDPMGTAAKDVKGVWTSTFSTADFSLRNERDRIWQPIVYGNEGGRLKHVARRTGILTGFMPIKEGLERGELFGAGVPGATPLQLEGLGIFKKGRELFSPHPHRDLRGRPISILVAGEPLTEQTDVYSQVGVKFLDFIAGHRASSARPKGFRALQESMLTALSTELKQKETAIIPGLTPHQQLHVKGFMEEAALADQMSRLGKGMGDVAKEAKKKRLTGAGDIDGARKKLIRFNAAGVQEGTIADAHAAIANVRALYAANADKLARFNKQIAPFEGFLKEAKKSLSGTADASGAFIDSLGRLGSKLTGGSVIQASVRGGPSFGGIRDFYMTKLLERDFANSKTFKEILRANPGFAGGRLIRWLHAASDFKVREDYKDFLDNVEGGKIMNLYVWVQKIRPMIGSYTPAHFVDIFMKKAHYFGARVEDDFIDYSGAGGLRVFAFGNKGKEFGWAKAFKGVNHIDVKFEFAGVNVNFVTQGDKFFEAPLKIASDMGSAEAGFFDRTGAAVFAFTGADAAEKQAEFIALMSNDLAAITEGTSRFLKLNKDNFDDFVGTATSAGYLSQFSQWLKNHHRELGLTLDGHGNIANTPENVRRIGLFLGLLRHLEANPDYISILRKYAGWLEKLSSKINLLQSALVDKLGIVFRRFINWKNVAAEIIADALAGLFSGATEGIGAIIAPYIRRFTKFVVYKVLEFVETFFIKLIFKQDIIGLINDLLESAEKRIKNTMKILAYLSIIPALFFAVVIFIVIIFLSVISPIFSAKGGDFLPGGFYSPGSTTVNCFNFVSQYGVINVGAESFNITPWPGALLSKFKIAVSELQSRTGNYIPKICAKGKVNVYKASDSDIQYCGYAPGTDIMVFTGACNFYEQILVTYLFAHESGHIYDHRYGHAGFSEIYNVVGPLPSYPFPECGKASESETFAEMIGIYIQPYVSSCKLPPTYSLRDYPAYYNYVISRVFR